MSCVRIIYPSLTCFQVRVAMFKDGLLETTALGAALLGWVGVGEYADFDGACQVRIRYISAAYALTKLLPVYLIYTARGELW